VEYFVSYYDYYQPEAYVPRTDTYIEKESSINEQIDRMRHSATRALLERDDVIIVASVSCIYGIGSVETYTAMTFQLEVGASASTSASCWPTSWRCNTSATTRPSSAARSACAATRSSCSRPTYEDRAWRLSLFGDEIEEITEFDPLTGHKTGDLESVKIYANSHYVTPRRRSTRRSSDQGRAEEPPRGASTPRAACWKRSGWNSAPCSTRDAEATGSCAGIENYSRYLTGRAPGEPPPTLFEYLPDNASSSSTRATSPSRRSAACTAATSAARRRWPNTASACRPASTTGRCASRNGTRCARRPSHVSATPGGLGDGAGRRRLRRTGHPPHRPDRPAGGDPPGATQVDDCSARCEVAAKGYRTLVTVLTKRMAEDLTEYMHEQGVRVRYMHSDIDTLERIEIIRDLRLGAFDVLVGINLLREGLDIPECALVAILDADKEGFLRSETSLIQTIGRAARNVDGRVMIYADKHDRLDAARDGRDQPPPREAAGLQRRARHHAGEREARHRRHSRLGLRAPTTCA
jgi:excinuclease ABC subunit B